MTALPMRLAVTAGEPAGIGPELLVRLAQQAWPFALTAFCDGGLLQEVARALQLPLRLIQLDVEEIASPHVAGALAVRQVALRAPVTAGVVDPRNAAFVVETLELACDACVRQEFEALVTAPVHKGVINDAGVSFTGHTEFFGDRTGHAPLMLLVADSIRVALVTTHLPLARVPAAITTIAVQDAARRLHFGLRERFGFAAPRIAVLGLNPHAGEGGHLGVEEQQSIAPAIAALRSEGIDVSGPLAADTAFVPARLAAFDAVLAMYHDQALPVLKHAGFGHGVNVTLGLPFVRTSVDHGVALDVAGKGLADPSSLFAATALAAKLAAHEGSSGAAPEVPETP